MHIKRKSIYLYVSWLFRMLFLTCFENQILFGIYRKVTEIMRKITFSVADIHSYNSGVCNPAKSKFPHGITRWWACVWSDAGSNSTIIWFLLFVAAKNCHYIKISFVRITKWISVFVIHQTKPGSRVLFLLCFFLSFIVLFCFNVFVSFCRWLAFCVAVEFISHSLRIVDIPDTNSGPTITFRDWVISWLSTLQANDGAAPQNGPWPFPFLSSSLHSSLTILLFYAIFFLFQMPPETECL